jgi:hypothetical protein
MAVIGHIEEFVPDALSIMSYLERIGLFFVANNEADGRKAAVLLSGGKTYDLLCDLLSPDKFDTSFW